jgi:hypothetical protein
MIPLHRNPAFYQLLANSSPSCLVVAPLPVDEATEWLYESAPFAVLAHNADPDPLFIYGNKAAQRRFGYSWMKSPDCLPDSQPRPRIARSGSNS